MLKDADYLILGNWKMHLQEQEAAVLASIVVDAAQNLPHQIAVGITPVALHLPAVRLCLQHSRVLLGVQDCHYEDQGAFTGDISPMQVKDIGAAFTLLGHSERRQYHGENNEIVCRKAEAALRHELHAVICVGETLAERESGHYKQIVEKQLKESLPAAGDRDTITIAYEPIWAIGTGKTAQNRDIKEMHSFIGAVLKQLYGETAPRILYGGSVKANNALEILTLPVVHGVLVGGASLDADGFTAIMRAASVVASASV